MHLSKNLSTPIGWFGMIIVVLAYTSGVFGWLSTTHWPYLALNLIGSIALVIETRAKGDTPPMVLNVIWAVIAAVGILTALRFT